LQEQLEDVKLKHKIETESLLAEVAAARESLRRVTQGPDTRDAVSFVSNEMQEMISNKEDQSTGIEDFPELQSMKKKVELSLKIKLIEENKSLQTEIANLKALVESMQVEVGVFAARVSEAEASVHAAQSAVEASEMAMRRCKRDLSDAEARQEEEREKLKAEAAGAKANLERVADGLDAAAALVCSEVQHYSSLQGQHEEECERLRAEVARLQSWSVDARQDAASADITSVASFHSGFEAEEHSLQVSEHELLSAREELARLKAELSASQAALRDLAAETSEGIHERFRLGMGAGRTKERCSELEEEELNAAKIALCAEAVVSREKHAEASRVEHELVAEGLDAAAAKVFEPEVAPVALKLSPAKLRPTSLTVSSSCCASAFRVQRRVFRCSGWTWLPALGCPRAFPAGMCERCGIVCVLFSGARSGV
jgi:chromosome segregation ATPase